MKDLLTLAEKKMVLTATVGIKFPEATRKTSG